MRRRRSSRLAYPRRAARYHRRVPADDLANPLIEVQHYGQSIWYDFIRRSLVTSGELQALVDRDGVLGVTSNPAIFEKALAGSPY